MKQTSTRISTLASRYLRMTHDQLKKAIADGDTEWLLTDIRSLAASLLAQDETRGKHE